MAMAVAVAGMAATDEVIVEDAECVTVSFPEFYDLFGIELNSAELVSD
jgi:5-enolpyruvylshikimate-3-phosphate synthase